ncbi:MAG: hypothetical protein FD136_1594 [Chitinophagaceae bacterium]|nr:MAG: hypothetical protein FD136_1594 [Chitinophagaceae bacterium]
MKHTIELIKELDTCIANAEKVNPAVSSSSVGWHIDHCLMVINQIIGAVNASNPQEYKWSFNFKRLVVFTTGKIPRGKAKAPATVVPTSAFDEVDVRLKMEKSLQKLTILNQLPANHFFVHPFFGHLNVKGTKKMLALHTKHHLEIINDIIKGA